MTEWTCSEVELSGIIWTDTDLDEPQISVDQWVCDSGTLDFQEAVCPSGTFGGLLWRWSPAIQPDDELYVTWSYDAGGLTFAGDSWIAPNESISGVPNIPLTNTFFSVPYNTWQSESFLLVAGDGARYSNTSLNSAYVEATGPNGTNVQFANDNQTNVYQSLAEYMEHRDSGCLPSTFAAPCHYGCAGGALLGVFFDQPLTYSTVNEQYIVAKHNDAFPGGHSAYAHWEFSMTLASDNSNTGVQTYDSQLTLQLESVEFPSGNYEATTIYPLNECSQSQTLFNLCIPYFSGTPFPQTDSAFRWETHEDSNFNDDLLSVFRIANE